MTKQIFTGTVLIVGKICSGKTTLANSIKKELNALQQAVIITDDVMPNKDENKNKINLATIQSTDVIFNGTREHNCSSKGIKYIIFMTYRSYIEFNVIGKYYSSHENYVEKYEHFKTPYNYVIFNVTTNKFSEHTNFMVMLKNTYLSMNNLETDEKKNVIGNVVIYGMKGSGKSTLAKKIADTINPFQSVIIHEGNNIGNENDVNDELRNDVINIFMYNNAPMSPGIKKVMYYIFLDEISMFKFIDLHVIGTPQDKEICKEYFKTPFNYTLYNGKTNRFYYDTTVEILMGYDSKVKNISDFPYEDISNISIIGGKKSGKNTLAHQFNKQFADEHGHMQTVYEAFSCDEDDYCSEIMITNEFVTNTIIINSLSHIMMMDNSNNKEFESMFRTIPVEYVNHLNTKYNFVVYDIKKDELTMYSAVKASKPIKQRKINGSKNILVLGEEDEKYSNFIEMENAKFVTELPTKLVDIRKISNIVITDPKYFPKFEKLYGKIPNKFRHLAQCESLWYSADGCPFNIIGIENDRIDNAFWKTLKNNKNTISLFIVENDNHLMNKSYKVIKFSKEKYDNDVAYYNEFIKYTTMLSQQEDFKDTIITTNSSSNIPKSFISMFDLVYFEKKDEKCVIFKKDGDTTYPAMINMRTGAFYN